MPQNMSKRRRLIVAIAICVVLLVGIVVTVILPMLARSGTERVHPADSIETLNGVEFRHYFTEAAGFTWHSVEAGPANGQVIVFIHGIPGAWYSWHDVMAALADNYRVIAVDLKGLGLTDQPETGYSAEVVANEIVQLMDALNVNKFVLVSHEWGSIVGTYLAGLHPQRVSHFVRLEAPLSDAALSQIQTLKNIPQIGSAVLADAEGFVRRMYTGKQNSLIMASVPGPVVKQPVAEDDMLRIIKEFSYKGIPQSIIRYYTQTPADFRQTVLQMAVTSTMPALLLQGDSDPIQPLSFYTDAAAAFPDATFQVLKDCGHVPMLEQPAVVASAIREFLTTHP
jgi:epoxide hydrolase 4